MGKGSSNYLRKAITAYNIKSGLQPLM